MAKFKVILKGIGKDKFLSGWALLDLHMVYCVRSVLHPARVNQVDTLFISWFKNLLKK